MGAVRAGNFKTVGQSNAQVVGGGLRFDSGKSYYLSRTPSSASNRKTWTWAGWVKRSALSTGTQALFFAGVNTSGNAVGYIYFNSDDTLQFTGGVNAVSTDYQLTTTQVFRDPSSWYHFVFVFDTDNATSSDRLRIFVNGTRVTAFSTASYPSSGYSGTVNNTVAHSIGSISAASYFNGYLASIYFIDGQALDPSYFGFTDPLTNTWRPKKLDITKTPGASFGTNGFYLPFDGSAPIGQDQSGKGNNWTPVNFGGSTSLDKATGALPILNTDGGGKVARVGVRTDANASSLVLALPLVGIKSDFSNKINSGTTEKAITVSNASASSSFSNFYGGSFSFNGSNTYLSFPSSNDFLFGTGDFTVECWVYANNTSSIQCIVGSYGGGASGWSLNVSNRIGVGYDAGRVGLGFGDTAIIESSSGLFNTNQWNHLAITREGTLVRLFYNGVGITTSTSSININAANSTFGVGYEPTLSRYFNGYLQDFRIYKGFAKYTSNFIPASTDPDIVPDSPSGVSYSSNVALVPSTDGAVAFDGDGDYVTAPYSTDFNFTGDFTLECFVYFSASPSTVTYGMKLISVGDGNSSGWFFGADTNNKIYIGPYGWATGNVIGATSIITNRWYHVACVRSSGTITIYVNGIADASATKSGTTENSGNTALHIGTYSGAAGDNNHTLIGLMSNVHITNTALYTTNFTPPSAPISSVANTKLLCCKSPTSATAYDVSPGTITATNALASNFNPFTANINTQRGKSSGYCTLNPLQSSGTLSNGNLSFSSAGANWYASVSNIFRNAGKWYCEYFITSAAGPVGSIHIGIVPIGYAFAAGAYIGNTSTSYAYRGDGTKTTNQTFPLYATSFTTGDLIGVAFDADSGTLTFYKNGVSQGQAFSGISGDYAMAVSCNGENGVNSVDANFGQKPFKFPPPAGFQPLTLANTPRPTIVRPDQYVGVTTYVGDGVNGRVINVGFKPDLVWIKVRDQSYQHNLWDSVRGAGSSKNLSSNLTDAEGTSSNPASLYGYVSSFTSNGFALTSGSSNFGYVNGNVGPEDYVAWAWKAGGSGGGNSFWKDDVGYATASAAGLTGGSVTPSGASVNTKSGFSIITFNASGSQTIPHGLGKTPSLIIQKVINYTYGWNTYFNDNGTWKYGVLNSTDSFSNSTTANMGATPTSTTVSLGSNFTDGSFNYVYYIWSEIPGFSKFGSYTGNGSSNGPVIITGFRPRWLLAKSAGSGGWVIYDTARDTYNFARYEIYPNSPTTEVPNDASYSFDFLSNGFKVRRAGDSSLNTSGQAVIYAAFAESPSFNLYGAQANAR